MWIQFSDNPLGYFPRSELLIKEFECFKGSSEGQTVFSGGLNTPPCNMSMCFLT